MDKYLYKPQELGRPRIEKMLDNIFRKPLFILVAPIGYGKTTAIRSFLDAKKDINVFWISLKYQEEDEMWLWSRIMMAMQRSGHPAFAEKNIELSYTKKRQMDFLRDVNTGFDKTTVLVLDDYHHCNSEFLNSIIEELAYMKVRGLHIIIISRTYPDLPCEEMMLKDSCVLMGQRHLEFSEDEQKQFFEINGCCLSNEENSFLYRYTTGWASAIYLSLLDYLRNGKIGNLKSVYHLMETSIVGKMEEDEKELLIMLAPLESFTGEEAEFITGCDRAVYILSNIWKNNSFISYSAVNREYSIHALLQAVLKDEFTKRGYSLGELHQRCAKWYELQGKTVYAAQYYMLAGMAENTFLILEQEDCFEIYRKAKGIFTKIFNQIPLELKAKHIKVYIPYIYQCIIEGDCKEAGILLNEVYEYLSGSSECSDQIMGELHILYSMLCYNDFNEMLKEIKLAYKLFNGRKSETFTISRLSKYGLPEFFLFYHCKLGKLSDNVKTLKTYYYYLRKIAGSGDNGFAMLLDAEYAFTRGNMEEAIPLGIKAYHQGKSSNHRGIILSSLCVCLKACLYQGDADKFKHFLKNMQKERQEGCIADYEQIESYIYICMGLPDKVCGWIQNFHISLENDLVEIAKGGGISYGNFLMQKKRYIELEKLARDILQEDSNENTYIYIQIYANIFLAVALYHLNKEASAATDVLSKAVELMRADGIKMITTECPEELVPILDRMEKDSFILELLDICYKGAKGRKEVLACYYEEKKEEEPINLTEREVEVMRLVSNGYKNVEIGEQLHIALVTVEKTLSHIYQKLGVTNRTAAVTKLREKQIL